MHIIVFYRFKKKNVLLDFSKKETLSHYVFYHFWLFHVLVCKKHFDHLKVYLEEVNSYLAANVQIWIMSDNARTSKSSDKQLSAPWTFQLDRAIKEIKSVEITAITLRRIVLFPCSVSIIADNQLSCWYCFLPEGRVLCFSVFVGLEKFLNYMYTETHQLRKLIFKKSEIICIGLGCLKDKMENVCGISEANIWKILGIFLG